MSQLIQNSFLDNKKPSFKQTCIVHGVSIVVDQPILGLKMTGITFRSLDGKLLFTYHNLYFVSIITMVSGCLLGDSYTQ